MELTDEVLREALLRLNEIEMSQVPNDEDIDIEFSDEFERRIRELINGETEIKIENEK